MSIINIAIDGPSGAGKSSLAKALAKELNFIYVDTGALYRAIGLFVLNNKIATNDFLAIEKILNNISINFNYQNGIQHVFVNGEDVTDLIRTQAVSMAASDVSAIPKVREFLLDLQKNIAKNENIVMDGRDVGTVILPNADIKIFLTASAEDRAKRRYEELIEKGIESDFATILEEINKRDYNDSNRAIAPLKKADDALLIDNTGFTPEETFKKTLETIQAKIEGILP